MTAQFMKVPKGKNPGNGVVICRGETHNLWKATETFSTPYTTLSEGEAYVEGLRMKPGTMMPDEVGRLQKHIQEVYGIDIKIKPVRLSGGESVALHTYLRDYTIRWPQGHPRRNDPFDLGDWLD